MSRSEVEVAGLKITNVSESQLVEHVASSLRDGRGGWIVTANADIGRVCHQKADVKHMVNRADLIVADGMPLIWASRLQGTPLQDRVCGSDLVWSIAQRASLDGRSLFLLGGGQPDTAVRAAAALQHRFPTLRIAGTHFPPFGFERDDVEMAEIEHRIKAAKPDIVYVALGFPKAEKLIDSLRARHPYAWWIGVGISLSFISGDVARAPRWMQVLGLEWVHRLLQEPGRLAKRYLWHDIPFASRLLFVSGIRRLRGSHQRPSDTRGPARSTSHSARLDREPDASDSTSSRPSSTIAQGRQADQN